MSTLLDSIGKIGAAKTAPASAATYERHPESLESITPRQVCLMRFVLAVSALAVIYLDPTKPDRLVALTYAALLGYTAYSGLLYAFAAGTRWRPSSTLSAWIDVSCYLVFIALSSGAGGIFFYFVFFSILVAAFHGGYLSGLNITFFSAVVLTAVGYSTFTIDLVADGGQQGFELNRFLLRPVSLLVLGYMISVWGGSELTLKRRLELLRSIGRSANLRFGVDRTIGDWLEAIRKFYDADTCLLVSHQQETREYFLRRADRYAPDRAARAEKVSWGIGWQLTSLPGEEALAVVSDARWSVGRRRQFIVGGGARARAGDASRSPDLASLAQLIGEGPFLSAPWRQTDGAAARLYVTSPAIRPLGRGDLEFLCQVAEHVAPLIENIELVDRLASTAADQERRRISLDLHDSTVQPYLGLKLGLESLCRKATPDNPLAGDLRKLVEKTKISLAELRGYVRGLRREEAGRDEPPLSAAVREYAEQFTKLYGLEVACEAEPDIAVSDRLAAEAFQIVREGLNNVERHTSARRAAVRLFVSDGKLVIEIENPGTLPPSGPFKPRSIKERAAALGGTARVVEVGDSTIVRAEIPV